MTVSLETGSSEPKLSTKWEFQKERAMRGLCATCTSPKKSSYYCEMCLDIRRKRDRARYQARKEQTRVGRARAAAHRLAKGLCLKCTNPLFTRILCETHTMDDRAQQRARHAAKKAKQKAGRLDAHLSKIFGITTKPEKKRR